MTSTSPDAEATIRLARRSDLDAILWLIAEDESGHHDDRPNGDLSCYERAFEEISDDSRNELFVAEADGAVNGTFQLSYLPHIVDGGRERAQIEAMFVAKAVRGQGIGRSMIRFALERARARGCFMAQLNSNKSRHVAHRFYEASGFVRSHEGFKAIL